MFDQVRGVLSPICLRGHASGVNSWQSARIVVFTYIQEQSHEPGRSN
jgi:hypothetical protein